jgi:hypothetical protein
MAAEDHALPHVGAEKIELLVAVEIDEADVRNGWRVGISGIDSVWRTNCTGDSEGSGQRSGAGRRSGARLRKYGRTASMSGGSATRLRVPAGPIGGSRFSRMKNIRTNSSRQALLGRMSGGGKA